MGKLKNSIYDILTNIVTWAAIIIIGCGVSVFLDVKDLKADVSNALEIKELVCYLSIRQFKNDKDAEKIINRYCIFRERND